jgi:hypothetical protein
MEEKDEAGFFFPEVAAQKTKAREKEKKKKIFNRTAHC